MESRTTANPIVLGIVVLVAILVAGLGSRLFNSVLPASIVVTGTSDTNTLEIAGKPVKAASDGIQTVSLDGISAAKDPCYANDLQNFNTSTVSGMVVPLVPSSPQILKVCGIHVQLNTANDVTINIIEGGGMNCSDTPKVVTGDKDGNASKGIRISGGFVRGDGGATIYTTSAPNRGFCVQTGGAGVAILSGTFHAQ